MTNLDVANRFFNGLLAGDAEALEAVFAPGATFWQNFSDGIQRRDEFLPRFGRLASLVTDLHFEDVRRTGTSAGFVEQHTLCGVTPAGEPMAIRGCFLGTVQDGQITAIEEYLDSAQLAPLMAARRKS